MLKIDIWRALFVKCFSFIFSLLFAFSAESRDFVQAYQAKQVENGEIYKVEIVSNKSPEELALFKNKKINDFMYVLDFIRTEEDSNLFEVFITDPPRPQKDKKVVPPAFAIKDIKYNYQKKNSQGEIELINYSYNYPEKETYGWMLGLFFCLAIIFIILFIKKAAIKDHYSLIRLKKKKTKFLIEILNQAETREEFEAIIIQKKYLHDLFTVDESHQAFLSSIEEIQYKERWTDEDIENLVAKKNKMNNLRPKYGV